MPARPRPSSARWLFPAAVLGATAMAAMRHALDHTMYVSLFSKALLHPDGLAKHPLIVAAASQPYTVVPWLLARAFMGLASATGLSFELIVSAAQVLAWLAHAAMMYRLVLAATESEEAAALGTFIIGLDMPIVWADAPYCLQHLERTLGAVPLLWGLAAMLRGRRWTALAGMGAATYLHANPAIYVWPLVVLEDWIANYRSAKARRNAAWRLLASAAIVAPLFAAAGQGLSAGVDPEDFRLVRIMFAPWIGGAHLSLADHLRILEGLVLIACLFWRQRGLPAYGTLMRSAALGLVMAATGSLAYWASGSHPGLVGFLLKMQLWIGFFNVEWAGQVLLASWLFSQMRPKGTAWPVVFLVLALSSAHDFVSRALAVALCALSPGPWAASVMTLGLAALAPLWSAFPSALRSVAGLAGLRGNLFTLPAFQLPTAAGLAAALALWHRLRRRPPSSFAPYAVCAYAVLLAAVAILHRPAPAGPSDARRMADWLRENTPPDAEVLATPMKLPGVDCHDFMTRSERSVFACPNHFFGIIVFGRQGAPMLDRMRLAGLDTRSVRAPDDLEGALLEADRRLDPASLGTIAEEYGVDYLLTTADRPREGEVLRREGELILYRMAPPLTARPRR